PVRLGVGLGAGGGGPDRLAQKLGATRVVTAGLVGLAVVLSTALFWTPGTAVWLIGFTLVGLAFFMGNVMAPATASVMSAVPEAKAGVGSAMNDVNREVGGALGVAIIGSIMNSVYPGRMTGAAAELPADLRHPARGTHGSAHAVAQHLPAQAAHHLNSAAANAFTHALGIGFLAAAIAAAVAAPIVSRYLRDRRPATRAHTPARAAEAAARA